MRSRRATRRHWAERKSDTVRAFIYIGGGICAEGITERPESEDLILAADAGYFNARQMGVKPSVVLGDFDSMDESGLPHSVERIRVPAQKDETDTQLAINYALEKGAKEIVLIGGLDGRLDHALSNLMLLEALDVKFVHAKITDGFNRVRFLRNNSTLLPRSQFRYFSLIAADEKVKGVSIDGCKYPLKKATLTRKNASLGVSNEIVGNCALIDVRRGGVWIVESK